MDLQQALPARAATPAGRRVLQVASELFYQHGINPVGMDLVAERAEVTKKTIYDRFGSKAALVAAYLAARDEDWKAWLGERLAAIDEPRERLLATFDLLGERMKQSSTFGCAFVNAAAELRDPDHPGRGVIAEQKRWTRAMFADLVAEVGGGPELADALFMLFEGAVIASSVAELPTAIPTARAAADRLLTLT